MTATTCMCFLGTVWCFDTCGYCEMIPTLGLINIPSPAEQLLCGECVEVHSVFPLITATLMFMRAQVLISRTYVQKILFEPLTQAIYLLMDLPCIYV